MASHCPVGQSHSIQQVPAPPAPQSCHLIQRESSEKHLPLTSLVLGATADNNCPPQNQAPQPLKERRASHPLRPGFIYTTTSVWVGRERCQAAHTRAAHPRAGPKARQAARQHRQQHRERSREHAQEHRALAPSALQT